MQDHLKVDSTVLKLMEKLTLCYINYISKISSDICNDSGKKTLNINHILEALKGEGFESHIKHLQTELKIDVSQETLELGNEVNEMKERINQKKKKKKDKKKNQIEFDEDMKNEQMRLFEMSRIEAYNIMCQEVKLNENINYGNKTIVEDSFIGNTLVEEEENYD